MKLPSTPKQLFLLDGIGALVSAFMLGFVLMRLEHIFGIPREALGYLSGLPVLFAIYDFLSYANPRQHRGSPLAYIAILNILYCIFSLGMAIYHRESLTVFGWAYLLGEIALVAALGLYEWKIARQHGHGA